jgi:hypothetical protein
LADLANPFSRDAVSFGQDNIHGRGKFPDEPLPFHDGLFPGNAAVAVLPKYSASTQEAPDAVHVQPHLLGRFGCRHPLPEIQPQDNDLLLFRERVLTASFTPVILHLTFFDQPRLRLAQTKSQYNSPRQHTIGEPEDVMARVIGGLVATNAGGILVCVAPFLRLIRLVARMNQDFR